MRSERRLMTISSALFLLVFLLCTNQVVADFEVAEGGKDTGNTTVLTVNGTRRSPEDEVQAALEYVAEVERTRDNCTFGKALPLTYDDSRWEHEALVAVKAANLLTDLLTTETDHMKGREPEDDYLLYSVVRSNVEEFPTIVGSAIAFDKYYYRQYELFCPYAWRYTGIVNTKDLSIGYNYHDPAADWFSVPYEWYKNVSSDITKSTEQTDNATNPNDSDAGNKAGFPLVAIDHGYWTYPYFDCGGGDVWMITFSVPFFRIVNRSDSSPTNATNATDSLYGGIPAQLVNYTQESYFEFAGVTTIDVDLDQVDINQCDVEDNADVDFDPFVNTHKCKTETTRCQFIPGQGFRTGAYVCLCKQGYYFPDPSTAHAWFNGSEVEDQYKMKLHGQENRYDDYFDCLPCLPGCEECVDGSPCFVEPNTYLRIAIVAINGLPMLLLVGFAVFTFKYKENKVVKAASPGLLYVILIGAFITYTVTIIEYFPPNDVTCMTKPWVRHIGFALAYGALLFKTWRITVIFRVRSAKPIRIRDTQLYGKIAIVLALFCLYLTVWTVVSRVRAVIKYNNEGLKFWDCTLDGWRYGGMGLELAFLIWGVYLCIRVRKAPSQFNESKYISLAIYNETLLSLFTLVLSVVLHGTAQTDIMFVLSFARNLLTVTAMVVLLFVSKIYLVRKNARDKSDDNKTTTGHTKAKRAAKKAQVVFNVDVSASMDKTAEPIDFKRDKKDIKDELDRIYAEMEGFATDLKIVSSQAVSESLEIGAKSPSPSTTTKRRKPKLTRSKSIESASESIEKPNWTLKSKT
ncbi:metabotropic glycine receptor-like [Ptychodera flava]|uniref:metabotropic glycine receptor-like n=1 Tax=Ptychodera flava TaxID=63121 RepID=UPI00396A2DBD